MVRFLLIGRLAAASACLALSAVPAFSEIRGVAGDVALCVGQRADDDLAREARESRESGSFFLFAKSLLGAPSACAMTESTMMDDQRFFTLTYRFKEKGAVLLLSSLPPETSIDELSIPSGFRHPEAARDFLEKTGKEIGLAIDWSKPPQIEKDGNRVRSLWWDPGEGLNASATLVHTPGGKLVGIRISMAL